MRLIRLPFLTLAAGLLSGGANTAHALWPQPSLMTSGNEALRVDLDALQIHLPANAPADLQAAAKRTVQQIKSGSIAPLIVGRGKERKAEVDSAKALKTINVILGNGDKVKRSVQEPTQVALRSSTSTKMSSIYDDSQKHLQEYDEAYTLTVPSDGSAATLSANSSLGAFRGMTTLSQLFWQLPGDGSKSNSNSSSTSSSMRYLWGAPFDIQDKPAFPYRGLLLDTSRNYYPIDALKRQVDTMAFVKMNQFHWHIVDSQSFPLVLQGDLSTLSTNGAYSADQVYSPEDIADFVKYAGERGVSVNVEIDMPGHTYEGVKDLPGDLVACQNVYPNWVDVANEPPSGQLKLGNDAVDKYVSGLIEQTAKLFPSPRFSHGGDEVNLNCYNATQNSDIDASLLKPFVQNAQAAVLKSGKVPMVWEEMAINFPETGKILANGTIVETWTGPQNVAPVLNSNPGVVIIHAPNPYFYLDCGRGEWLTGAAAQSWCPYVSWQISYSFDPYNGTETVPGGRERVMGGEAALWSEQSDETQADQLIWPRTAAAAEVFWTGANFTSNGVQQARNASEAQARVNDLRFRLVERGIRAQPTQPLWCALRPDQCPSPSAS